MHPAQVVRAATHVETTLQHCDLHLPFRAAGKQNAHIHQDRAAPFRQLAQAKLARHLLVPLMPAKTVQQRQGIQVITCYPA